MTLVLQIGAGIVLGALVVDGLREYPRATLALMAVAGLLWWWLS